jgi:hypothetical protein
MIGLKGFGQGELGLEYLIKSASVMGERDTECTTFLIVGLDCQERIKRKKLSKQRPRLFSK